MPGFCCSAEPVRTLSGMNDSMRAERLMRATLPGLERRVEELRSLEEATRGSFMHEGFVRDLDRHERALAAFRRDL